ncbi:MAG TPA: MFS transporter [Aggregatilineaceae bacterium]|nr:MFS transporter [Aggregatilineaceae bacterium]
MAKITVGFYQLAHRLFYRKDTSIFSVLKERDYRNLWIGQSISFIGDSLAYNTMTLAIIMMAKHEDAQYGSILGLLAVLSSLPPLLLGMVAGTIADRANRKTIMITADVLRGFMTLAFLFVDHLDDVWIFLVVSVSLQTISVFFYPARTALMPEILNKEQLLSANALGQLTVTLSFVLGATLAGFLVQQDQFAPAFLFDSVSFFCSAYFITRISISGKLKRKNEQRILVQPFVSGRWAETRRSIQTMVSELIVGVRYVLTDQVMRGVLLTFVALYLGLGAANVTFVPLLIDELGMKSTGLGLIRFSQSLGIILGSAAIGGIATQYKARDVIGISMVLFGMTTILTAITPTYSLMVLVLFLVGITISPPQIVAPTLMQRHVPSEKLGRASGGQNTIVTIANIASMGVAGYLLDMISARTIFAVSGALIFLAGFVSWWVLRNVEDEQPESIPVSSVPETTQG